MAAMLVLFMAGLPWSAAEGMPYDLTLDTVSMLQLANVRQSVETETESFGQTPEDAAASPFKVFWGSAPWPKQGQVNRPPASDDIPKQTTLWQLVPCITVFSLVLCMPLGYYCYSSKCGWRKSLDSPYDSSQPLASGERSQQNKFLMHLQTLSCAILWRHTQSSAILSHGVRVAIPVVLLLLMNGVRDLVASQLKPAQEKWMSPSQTLAISSGILEFILTVFILYISLISMVFFVWHLNAESDSGLRHLLHVSGVSRPAYMLATVGVDGFCFLMFDLLFMLAITGTWLQIRMVLWSSPILFLLLMINLVFSTLLIGYLCHLLAPSARLASILAQITVALCTFQAPASLWYNVVPIAGEQSWLSIALPVFPAYRSLFELATGCMRGRCLTLDDVVSSWDAGDAVGPWKMVAGTSELVELPPPGALLSFYLLNLVQLVVGWTVVILVDQRCYPALHTSRARASNEVLSDDIVLDVKDLSHQYGWLRGMIPGEKKQILKDVSFSVPRGAILGLLGPNGAGKTTCIRCITGEEFPLAGSTTINSCDDALVGLCPQETVVNGSLTVMENLIFFAYVRGCTANDIQHSLEHFLVASCLKDKRDCLPDTLSGGMKRRLAVACSLIGMPAVAVLDEPTTGLDPLCRRGIWKTINEIKAAGSCCLLTTHMLEEAEALCSSLVVLKKGTVAASGSVQKLKEEWSTGYTLSIESKPGQRDVARSFLASQIPKEDSEPIKETSGGQMTFKLRIEEEALGHLIITIARSRESNGIRHWGLSQASLEDTYLKIIEHDLDVDPTALANEFAHEKFN